MSLTDEDIKRLEHNHARCRELSRRCIVCDLLARLEAAEELAKARTHPLHVSLEVTGDICPIAVAEAKWLKAAGKQRGEERA